MIRPCTYCGRLTAEEKAICSHCHTRVKSPVAKVELIDIRSDLTYWKGTADRFFAKYQKPVKIVKNTRGEMGMFPESLPVLNGCEVVYEIGGAEIENCQ